MQKNLISFGTYIALFPQLIAGPIVRFKSVEEELNCRTHSPKLFAEGVRLFVIGMGKKVILANNIGMLWENVQAIPSESMSVAGAWLGALAFTMQIYFDFSGYSDMAIGLGKMFGFNFPKNFDYPYMSKSITEFWRRWHISLGTWFKEYVYIPLGGNKRGMGRQHLNIFIVWALTGLWHGASWNFVIWGLYFSALLMIEKHFIANRDRFENIPFCKNPAAVKIGKGLAHVYTMFFVVISWVIFSLEDVNAIFRFMGHLFGFGREALVNSETVYLAGNYGVILIICILASTKLIPGIFLKIKESAQSQDVKNAVYIAEDVALLLLFVISMAYVVSSTYNPFLYFRF